MYDDRFTSCFFDNVISAVIDRRRVSASDHGAGAVVVSWQANGSLIHKDNVIRGSALIGQSFTAAGYFHGRPSATADTPYNPLASGGSNLAASNPELDAQIQSRVAALRAANPQASSAVPVELATASASGLDNNLTPGAAAWQIPAWRRLASFPLNRSRNWLQNIRTGRWRAFLGNRW